jgi:signal transduction histidine kinase
MLLSNATRHGDNPAFQQDLMTTVGESVARMKRMLTELGAEPRSRVRATTISVATLLEAVARARAHPALTVEPVMPDLTLVADADGLETAIGHLAQNALEAVRGTGRVSLRAVRCEGRVVIEVEDDGCGMSAAFVRDELFRPLSTTKSSGYGIGAFQARELVREMGGQLDVASTPGLGTTMRVSFPIGDAAAIRAEAGAVASALAPTGAGVSP